MKKLLLSFAAMLIGAVSMFAEERVVTITPADGVWGTTAGAQTGTKDGVTIATGEGMRSDTHFRTYKNQLLTVSVGEGTITGIEISCIANGTTKYGPGCFGVWSTGDYSYSGKVGTWTGSAEKVEFTASGNQVRFESIKVTYEVGAAIPDATALELTEASAVQTEYYVGDAFNKDGLVAIATFADESTKDVTEAAAWTCTPGVMEEDTKTVTVTATYKGLTASKTYDVTLKTIANTAETAYTVEEAVALIDAGKGLSVNVYVKGIISNVEKFDERYGSITYYLSTDGTETSQQFMCYSGLNVGGEKFTSIDDLKVGSSVVVMGVMKKYGDVYEFNYNNEVVSMIPVGIGNIASEGAAIEGKVVEDGRVVVLKAGKKFTVAGQRIK